MKDKSGKDTSTYFAAFFFIVTWSLFGVLFSENRDLKVFSRIFR